MLSIDGVAGNHHYLQIGFEFLFVQPVRFAHQPPGAIASHCVANLAACYDAQRAIRGWIIHHVQHNKPAGELATVFVRMPKLVTMLKSLGFRQCLASMQPDLRQCTATTAPT